MNDFFIITILIAIMLIACLTVAWKRGLLKCEHVLSHPDPKCVKCGETIELL